MTESEFMQEVAELAEMIVSEYEYTSTDDDLHSGCHETVDSHEWVIYTYKAQQICNLPASITDEGESWLEGIYSSPYEGCETFNDVCTRLAYAAMLKHVESAVFELLEEMEQAA